MGRFLAIVTVLVAGCAGMPTSHALRAEQLGAVGAGFEHLLSGDYALPSSSNYAVALCLPGNADAPTALIGSSHGRKTVECSALATRQQDVPVRLRSNGEAAFRCSVTSITTLPDGFRIEANCGVGPLSGSGYSYKVGKVGGSWTVIEMQHVWDS